MIMAPSSEDKNGMRNGSLFKRREGDSQSALVVSALASNRIRYMS
jgi:hypothetical protein